MCFKPSSSVDKKILFSCVSPCAFIKYSSSCCSCCAQETAFNPFTHFLIHLHPITLLMCGKWTKWTSHTTEQQIIFANIVQRISCCVPRFRTLQGEDGVAFSNHVLVPEHKLHIQAKALPSSEHGEI